MKIAISQPTYLPWIGYFDMMDQVDKFVLLDSVQFEKRSWQQRNRIKTPSGLQWLTVPVLFRGCFGQMVHEIKICDPQELSKHLRGIELNYRRAPYFENYFPSLKSILERCQGTLCDLNIQLIRWICRELGISTPIMRSSSMNLDGTRSRLLVNICNGLGAKSFFSAFGSSVYLLDDLSIFKDEEISVTFHNYIHPEYRQLFPPFIPYASVLDLLFNEGLKSMEIIRSGRRAALLPSQVAVNAHERAS